MISSIICVSNKHINSSHFSIQQEHIELFLKGSLVSLVLCDKDYNLINKYDKVELQQVIGEAIKNGRRTAENPITGATEFYYLAPR